MSGVVFMICIPTEEHEKFLLTKLKKKVTIQTTPKDDNLDGNVIGDFKPLEFSSSEDLVFESTPNKNEQHKCMQIILQNILEELDITNSTWSKGNDDKFLQIIFSVESRDRCEEILDILMQQKIGRQLDSVVSVIPCSIHYHGSKYNEPDSKNLEEENVDEDVEKNTAWNRFLSSVRARLTVAQVVENVNANAALTFDFICLILISTTLCAIGLVENSNVYLLSSMLISPMMRPVMAATFGCVIQDKRLQKLGVQNELLGLGIATIVGFCYGSVICIITDKYGNQEWPTWEMMSRGELRSLWVGCLIALLSGAAVALGILSDNIASLVGVAISTSLMPPAVNAGLLWSIAFVYYFKGNETTRYASLTYTDHYAKDRGIELLSLGAISVCLTFVNIVCIYVASLLVFKIKEVAPMASRDHVRRQFWNHDIKIARDYNKTLKREEAGRFQHHLSEEAMKKKYNELLHHSTDLGKENSRINIRRQQYTWSPCMDMTKRPHIREMQEMYENFLREKPGNVSRVLTFGPSVPKGQHKRLSQVFPTVGPNDEDKLHIIREDTTQNRPLVENNAAKGQDVGFSFSKKLSGRGKKFVVTRCEQDPLNGQRHD